MEKASKDSKIVILGMSDRVDRYAYMAYERLMDCGFCNIVGVTPKEIAFENIKIIPQLRGVESPVHTITLYIGSKKVNELIDDILSLNPKRIIFNPGTENDLLINKAKQHNIETVIGCTLVMLSTNQF